MSAYLLDTDTVISALRPAGTVVRERIRVAGAGAHVSAVTVMELRYGVALSTDPTRNAVATSQMLATLRVIDFDADAAEHAGRVRAALAAVGTPIGAYDTLIAGHALSLGVALVTHNTREFARVPGLTVVDWAS